MMAIPTEENRAFVQALLDQWLELANIIATQKGMLEQLLQLTDPESPMREAQDWEELLEACDGAYRNLRTRIATAMAAMGDLLGDD